MKIKIGSKKTNSYYGFLKGIEEEGLPVFSDEQIACINYLSSLLPLVRKHEYLVIKNLLSGETALSHIEANIQEENHVDTRNIHTLVQDNWETAGAIAGGAAAVAGLTMGIIALSK